MAKIGSLTHIDRKGGGGRYSVVQPHHEILLNLTHCSFNVASNSMQMILLKELFDLSLDTLFFSYPAYVTTSQISTTCTYSLNSHISVTVQIIYIRTHVQKN